MKRLAVTAFVVFMIGGCSDYQSDPVKAQCEQNWQENQPPNISQTDYIKNCIEGTNDAPNMTER